MKSLTGETKTGFMKEMKGLNNVVIDIEDVPQHCPECYGRIYGESLDDTLVVWKCLSCSWERVSVE